MLIHLTILLSLLACSQSLSEGDSCTKTDGSPGVCKAIHDCPFAKDDFQRHLIPMKCGNSASDPVIICCGESFADTPKVKNRLRRNTTTLELPTASSFKCNKAESSGRRAFSKCLEYQEKHVGSCTPTPGIIKPIIGGEDAYFGEFPHMALLGYARNGGKLNWVCGGVIISERYVLTAAHCTYSPTFGPVKKIRVGILKRSDPVDSSKEFNVMPIQHPQYHSPLRYHDIALLRTDREIRFNRYIMPACLHDGDEALEKHAIVSGWGTTVFGDKHLPDVLQKATVERFKSAECDYLKYRLMPNGFDSKTQLCYGHRVSNKDTCEGDSGGPLQVSHPSVCCMHWVIGITSWGKWCGVAGKPSIYTRLENYIPWIEEVVWPYP